MSGYVTFRSMSKVTTEAATVASHEGKGLKTDLPSTVMAVLKVGQASVAALHMGTNSQHIGT